MKKLLLILSLLLALNSCRMPSNYPDIEPSPKVGAVANSRIAMVGMGERPAYGIVIYPQQKLVRIPDIDHPEIWEVISEQKGSMYVGGDFVNGDFSKLYVISYIFNDLRSVDTSTGEVTIIGNISLHNGEGGWTGLTAAKDGTMYASSTDIIHSDLYTIDINNGNTTHLGEITSAPCIVDIAINQFGEMYGLDICLDMLVKIDPQTTRGEQIGSIGFDANYAQDMDFDDQSHTLYLAAFDRTEFRGELRKADIYTGTTELIGTFPDGDEVDCFAITTLPMEGGIYLPIVQKN